MKIRGLQMAALVAGLLVAGLARADEVKLVFSHPNMAPGEEVFMYAVPKKLGYFTDEGIDVTVQAASGGAQAAQVMMSGSADLSTTMAEGVLQLRQQGANVQAYYELKRNNGFAMGIPVGSSIKTLADLQGKTIGFPVAGGGTKMIVDESFRQAGLQPNYTAVVIGSGAPAAAAIQNHRVDAAVLWDAAFGVIENQGVKLNYLDLGVQDELAGMSLVASRDYLTNHRKDAIAYCRAMTKGLVFTLANKPAAIRIMFEEFPTSRPANVDPGAAIDPQVNILNKWLASALKGLPQDAKTGVIDPTRWTVTGQKYQEAKLLRTADTAGAFDTSFVEECNNFDHAAIVAQAKAYK